VSLSHFFSFWSKFSHDFKKEWQQQQKLVAKQRASALRRDKNAVIKKPVVAGGLVSYTLGMTLLQIVCIAETEVEESFQKIACMHGNPFTYNFAIKYNTSITGVNLGF